MNYKMLLKLLGIVMLIEAALLLLPMLVAAIYRESVLPFLITIGIILAVSIPATFIKPSTRQIYARDGFVCVASSWILLSLFGALPFVFSGAVPNYIDAVFETVSGFTTTGATILTEIESLPRGILFWRSFTHWIGGMGVLVFMLAILPDTSGNSIHLMRAEVPGPTKGKLVPKMRQTAIILYGIYLFFTVLETVILMITGLPLYDSLVTSFATTGTGGFAVKNASIAAYANPAAEWVISIFLFISGINYNLYYFILIGKIGSIFKSEEFRAYVLICLASTAVITVNLLTSMSAAFPSVGESIRAAFFQVMSIASTAGFSTVDFNLWPEFSKMILVTLMFIGACAGSTAGGLKVSRLIIILKMIKREFKHMLKPNSVNSLKLDGETLSVETGRSAVSYFSIYTVIIIATTLLISVDGLDFTTNFTATVACFNNVGPGLSLVGPMGNFSVFSYFSKILLSFVMLFGRLEVIPMVVILSPSTWKRA